MEFQVGDIVEDAITGEKFTLRSSFVFTRYPLESYLATYTIDGKRRETDKYPSIRLIERPKKKVKKVLKGWLNIFNTTNHSYMDKLCVSGPYIEKKEADLVATPNRIACIEINQEYEVEE